MIIITILISVSVFSIGLVAVNMGGEAPKPANKELEEYIWKTAA